MVETGERLEVKMSSHLKERLVELAAKEGASVGEVVVKLVCKALGEDPSRGLVPRKPPGRKPHIKGGQARVEGRRK